MENKTVSLTEAIKFGFVTTMDNIWLFLGLIFLQGLIRVLRYSGIVFLFAMHFIRGFSVVQPQTITWEFLASLISVQLVLVSALLYILFSILDYGFQAGMRAVMLELHDTGHSRFSTLFTSFPIVLNYAIAQMLYSVLVGFGFLLFVLPGVWFAVKYYFFDYVIVDKNVGPFESFKISSRITQGNRYQVLALVLLIWLVFALAFQMYGFTLLLAIPLCYGAKVYLYRRLERQEFVKQF
jgi:uncharacterized membrane protein